MRDAVRRVIDGTVEVEEGPEVFPREVEVALNAGYDNANDQNDVMKRLTVIASLLCSSPSSSAGTSWTSPSSADTSAMPTSGD